MPYYDENRNITIDEEAANADIRRIDNAINKLESTKKTLTSLMHQANEGKGMTTAAAADKALELINKTSDLINRLVETKQFIRNTVNHYQQVDAALASSMNIPDIPREIIR